MALVASPTELKYQQAVVYYTKTGMTHCLERQWKFLKSTDQRDLLIRSAIITLSAVSLCTWKGIQLGKYCADTLSLKDGKRTIFIVGGGSSGFIVGVGLSVAGQAWAIEHSARLDEWKKININRIIEKLMKEEFEEDPIWSQFECPIHNIPMFFPTRTPSGAVCELNALMECADSNGMIKDIYNTTIQDPNSTNPTDTIPLEYHITTCIQDYEMMIVIYKRFIHLVEKKSNENRISFSTKQFFENYIDSVLDFIKIDYLRLRDEIAKKRDQSQAKDKISKEESAKIQEQFEKEMEEFNQLFGNTPISDINWDIPRDWKETLNKRWVTKNH